MEINGLTNESAYKLQEEVLRPSRKTPQLPDWLQRASEEDRQYYFDAEQSLTESEQALDALLGEVKSLKAFARFQAREVVRLLSGEVVDPDHIFVRTHYTFFVGEQKVVQSNRLTLPEFMLNDLYGSTTIALEIKLEGDALPSGVTADDILEVMVGASMRKFHAEKFEKKYADEAVLRAQQILLSSRIGLSSFSAKLQGHISNESLRIVSVAAQGDEGVVDVDVAGGAGAAAAAFGIDAAHVAADGGLHDAGADLGVDRARGAVLEDVVDRGHGKV